jgi:hypothetical protein
MILSYKVRKIITFWLSPFMAIMLVLLKIPEVDKKGKELLGTQNAPLIFGALLGLVTLASHWFTTVSPYKKYEKWASKRWVIFESECNKMLTNYIAIGIDAKMNIMLSKRWLVNTLEPGRSKYFPWRLRLNQKVLHSIWGTSNNGNIDIRLYFTDNQGVCGEAFSSGKPASSGLTKPAQQQDSKLNKRQ